MGFFIWLEGTAVSVWIRETPSLLGFPLILYLHTLGLALLAGLSSAVALSILALGERSMTRALLPLFPLMWVGLAINALSGLALLIAYPAKALTNPVFYLKLLAIAGAVGIVQWLNRQLSPAHATAAATATTAAEHSAATMTISSAQAAASTALSPAYLEATTTAGSTRPTASAALRRAAWTLLTLWAIATLTGRLLAYTHSILLASISAFY